jgi:hypothetical protein
VLDFLSSVLFICLVSNLLTNYDHVSDALCPSVVSLDTNKSSSFSSSNYYHVCTLLLTFVYITTNTEIYRAYFFLSILLTFD